jgi:uncharacterized protein YcfL
MRIVVLITLAMFALVGCNKSVKPNSSIVKVVNKCGDNSITIIDVKGRKKPDGFMQAQIIGENSSSAYQSLEYRVVWFDKHGFIIESILSKWHTVPAYANQPFHVNAISPSTKARTFRLYIKKDKEVICDKHYDGY